MAGSSTDHLRRVVQGMPGLQQQEVLYGKDTSQRAPKHQDGAGQDAEGTGLVAEGHLGSECPNQDIGCVVVDGHY